MRTSMVVGLDLMLLGGVFQKLDRLCGRRFVADSGGRRGPHDDEDDDDIDDGSLFIVAGH